MTQQRLSQHEVLSEDHQRALQYEEAKYGDQLLAAAADLARIANLSPDVIKQFTNGLEQVIDRGASYPERHDVALHLQATAKILGPYATGQLIELPSRCGDTVEATTAGREQDITLSPERLLFFEQQYGVEVAQKINNMDHDRRLNFAANVEKLYLTIPIRGVSMEKKSERIKVLSQLLLNKKIDDIAEDYSIPRPRVMSGQEAMNSKLNIIVTKDDKVRMYKRKKEAVPKAKRVEQAPLVLRSINPKPLNDNLHEDEVIASRELVKVVQRSWLQKLHGEDYKDTLTILRFNEHRSSLYIGLLANHIEEYYAEKEEEAITGQRIDILAQLFVAGVPLNVISELHDHSTGYVSELFQQTGKMLKENVDPQQLDQIVNTIKKA